MKGSGRIGTEWEAASPASQAADRLDIEVEAAYRWAAHLVAGRSVLDVGSGSGHGAALLAERARSVVGVACSADEAESASRRHGDRIRFVLGEPTALNIGAGGFAALTCFGALERATDPDPVLAELRRVLDEGGLLIASLPLGDRTGEDPVPRRSEDGPGAMARRPDTSRPSRAMWQSILEAHFANISLRPRRIGIAVSISGDESTGRFDEPIEDACRIEGEAEDSRIALALASDAELPDPDAIALITGLAELTTFLNRTRMWEERARRAEAEGAAKHWELVAAREAQRRLRKRLHQLEHRPLRVLSRVLRGKPARLGPGPPLRLSDLPRDWN